MAVAVAPGGALPGLGQPGRCGHYPPRVPPPGILLETHPGPFQTLQMHKSWCLEGGRLAQRGFQGLVSSLPIGHGPGTMRVFPHVGTALLPCSAPIDAAPAL